LKYLNKTLLKPSELYEPKRDIWNKQS